jgi:hypothetical protein
MKKLFLLIGFAVGFVAGSKAGSGPYNQLESKVRSITRHRDDKGAAGESRDTSVKSEPASVKSDPSSEVSYPDVVDPMGGVMAPTAASMP